MEKPNWFDKQYASKFDSESPEKMLAEIAKDPRIVSTIKTALDDHEKVCHQKGWAGPSKTQVVRKAVAAVLNAD